LYAHGLKIIKGLLPATKIELVINMNPQDNAWIQNMQYFGNITAWTQFQWGDLGPSEA
jgi:hypothetical protein